MTVERWSAEAPVWLQAAPSADNGSIVAIAGGMAAVACGAAAGGQDAPAQMQNYYSERLGFFLSVGDTVWYLSEGAPVYRAKITAISEVGLFQDEPDFAIHFDDQTGSGWTHLDRLRPESHFRVTERGMLWLHERVLLCLAAVCVLAGALLALTGLREHWWSTPRSAPRFGPKTQRRWPEGWILCGLA